MTENIKRKVLVVTDAAADLPPIKELKKRYNIEPLNVLPLDVSFGNTNYTTGVDLSSSEYRKMVLEQEEKPVSERVIPKTGTKTSDYYFEMLKKLKEKDDLDILSINIGSKVSGVVDETRKAAEKLDPNRVSVYDTGTVSMAEGLMAIYAEKMAAAGATRQEIIDMLDSMKDKISFRVITPNMPYLRASGRVSHIQGLFGSILQINPILQIDHNKVNEMAKRPTTGKALDWLTKFVRDSGMPEQIAILDFNDRQHSNTLKNKLVDELGIPVELIYQGEFDEITSSHSGPRTLGVATLVRR